MRALKPIKLFFLSIIIWLFFYVQMPVEYLYNGSAFFPIITLLLFIISFIIGVISLKINSIKPLTTSSDKKIKQIIKLVFFIGFLGVLFKIYVGVFNTEIFTATDSFEKRLENMNKELSGGFIGVVGSVLFPFAYVAMLMVIYNYKLFSKLFLFIVITVGLYPFVETIFMGGRTIIALLGVTLLFVIFASYNKNTNFSVYKIKLAKTTLLSLPAFLLKKRVYVPLLIVGVVFTTYSINTVNKRLTRFGYGDRTFKVWERQDYQWVKFDKDFKKEYFRSSNEDQAQLIGYYSLKHYFVHGVIEYVRLVNHLESTTGYYYGQYQFNVFFKFFRAFGVPLKSVKEMQEVIDRKAVYKTFFGPFYLDFGVLGFIILFFWGRFVKRVYTHAFNGHTQYVVFYGYLCTIIITSVFINFLLGSSSYYLFAFLICILLFKIWPNNLVFTYKE